MNPGTLNAILGSAPVILQGAAKLIRMIREGEKKNAGAESPPVTLAGLREEIRRLDGRVDANSESDVEQIRLIEELAKQNEVIAKSLARTAHQIDVLTIVVIVAVLFGALAVILAAI